MCQINPTHLYQLFYSRIKIKELTLMLKAVCLSILMDKSDEKVAKCVYCGVNRAISAPVTTCMHTKLEKWQNKRYPS
jgi:hypothetical protein